MIKVYSGLKGFTALFFVIAGTILFLSIFFWGITKAIEFLLPLLIVVSYLLIFVFVIGFLPATLMINLRPLLGAYSLLMSYALGVTTWMMSFFFVMKVFGFWGILLAFLFQFLAPIALIGAILKGAWPIAVHLSLWIGFIYGMRFYSRWLSNGNFQDQKKGDIIDVDAIEVRDQ